MPQSDNENVDQGIPLANLIESLRCELEKSRAQADGKGIVFQTDKVELELSVAVSGTLKGGGGIQFWVVTAGGEYERARTTTHTFKLTLTPVDAETGSSFDVSHVDDRPPSDD